MKNALAEMDTKMPSMGNGLAQGAADLIGLHKEWKKLYTMGDTEMQFTEWLKSKGIVNPILPK